VIQNYSTSFVVHWCVNSWIQFSLSVFFLSAGPWHLIPHSSLFSAFLFILLYDSTICSSSISFSSLSPSTSLHSTSGNVHAHLWDTLGVNWPWDSSHPLHTSVVHGTQGRSLVVCVPCFLGLKFLLRCGPTYLPQMTIPVASYDLHSCSGHILSSPIPTGEIQLCCVNYYLWNNCCNFGIDQVYIS